MLNEVRLLYHRMVQVAERLHAQEPITVGMRAVLEYLVRNGPTPVPAIARNRHVSRQHIQGLVNRLLSQQLVTLAENPAHRRSSQVALTPEGERTIRRMMGREQAVFAQVEAEVSPASLSAATLTLQALRAVLHDKG